MTFGAATFGFRFDSRSGVLYTTLLGFLTIETACEYRDALMALIDRHFPGSTAVRIISDARDCPINRQEVVDLFDDFFKRILSAPGNRLASVVSSTLVKIQLNRLQPGAQTAQFDTIEAAEAWIRG